MLQEAEEGGAVMGDVPVPAHYESPTKSELETSQTWSPEEVF
jgi:hypothetical protein